MKAEEIYSLEFKTMSNDNLKIYRPSPSLVYRDVFIAAIAVMGIFLPTLLVVSYFLKADWFIFFFPAFFGAGITSIMTGRNAKTTRSISVSDNAISGPKYLAVGRRGFPLKEINIEKSNRRTVIQKLFGTQIIHSLSGEKLLFYRRVFLPSDIEEILARCKLM